MPMITGAAVRLESSLWCLRCGQAMTRPQESHRAPREGCVRVGRDREGANEIIAAIAKGISAHLPAPTPSPAICCVLNLDMERPQLKTNMQRTLDADFREPFARVGNKLTAVTVR
jgi:hypothetical protein